MLNASCLLTALSRPARHNWGASEIPRAEVIRNHPAKWADVPLKRLLLFTAILILVERIGSHLLGIEGLLPGVIGNVLVRPGDAGLFMVWAIGHCDSMDGPVITQAKKALEAGNVNLVLAWVRTDDEPEIRSAFENTLSVRKLGPQAQRLADMYFFETLVRVHRAGEGAPYRGIKPAGRDMGPAIPASDKALGDGSIEAVIKLINDAVRNGVHEHFHAALGRRKFDPDDVAAGREYVEAYVSYIHYVEGLWQAAAGRIQDHHAGHESHGHRGE